MDDLSLDDGAVDGDVALAPAEGGCDSERGGRSSSGSGSGRSSVLYKQSRPMHITHNIRYYAKLLLLRNTKRITQNMLIYAKPSILRNNLLGRLKQGALPFQCLAAGAAALARDPVLVWLWDLELFSKSIVHHRYESFLRFFAPLGLIR